VEKLLLTTQEAAKLLGIGRSSVYDLIRTNRLRTVKIGARRLVPVVALAEVVALLLDEDPAA
jgi:excisionase family DNA binding protein